METNFDPERKINPQEQEQNETSNEVNFEQQPAANEPHQEVPITERPTEPLPPIEQVLSPEQALQPQSAAEDKAFDKEIEHDLFSPASELQPHEVLEQLINRDKE